MLGLIEHGENLGLFMVDLVSTVEKKYAKEASKTLEKTHLRLVLIHLCMQLGKIYFENHLYFQAEQLLERAIDLLKSVPPKDFTPFDDGLANRGYQKPKLTDLEIRAKQMHSHALSVANLHLAVIYKENRRFDESLRVLESILESDLGKIKKRLSQGF